MSLVNSLLILAVILSFTGQGFFMKLFSISQRGDPLDVVPIFTVLYGLVIAGISFLICGFRFRPDLYSLLIGIVNGFLGSFYNLASVRAARSGPYTLQGLMNAFGNILIPVSFALFLWGDHLSQIQIMGIMLMLAAFLLYNYRGFKEHRKGMHGLLWFFLVFFTTGFYSAVNDVQQRLESGAHRQDLIIVIFLTEAFLSLLFFVWRRHSRTTETKLLTSRSVLLAVLTGLCAATAINMLMFTLHRVSSALVYPIMSGGMLVTNFALSRTALHEKLQAEQYAAIGIAITGLVLTNL